jgi:hypothetical protein
MRTLLAVAIAAVAIIAPATQAAPAARTFDRVTYTAPDGFTVDASAADHVLIQRVGAKSYCLIGIYNSSDASDDLDASFAAEWKDIVDRSVDPVDVPASQHATVAGAPAAIGAAMTTTGGKPVLAMLTTIDAGARVVSILVLTPNEKDLAVYTPSITSLLNSLSVKRVEAASPPASPDAASITVLGGKLSVTLAPRGMKLADLAGDWKNDDGSLTSYVSATTGAYAGFDSISTVTEWSIDAKKGTVNTNFHGVTAGNGGARAVDEKTVEKITLGADGDLFLQPKRGEGAAMHYLLRGYQVYPQFTVMVLVGPFFDDGIPDDVRQDPNQGSNLDSIWIKKNAKPTR